MHHNQTQKATWVQQTHKLTIPGYKGDDLFNQAIVYLSLAHDIATACFEEVGLQSKQNSFSKTHAYLMRLAIQLVMDKKNLTATLDNIPAFILKAGLTLKQGLRWSMSDKNQWTFASEDEMLKFFFKIYYPLIQNLPVAQKK